MPCRRAIQSIHVRPSVRRVRVVGSVTIPPVRSAATATAVAVRVRPPTTRRIFLLTGQGQRTRAEGGSIGCHAGVTCFGEFSAGDTEMGRGRRPPRPVCGSARYLHGTVGTGRGRGCDGVAASVVCLLYYSPCRAAAGPRSPGCRPRPLDVPCPCPHACCYTPAPHAIPNQKGALGRTGSAAGTTARTSSTPSITNPVPITAIRSPVARRSTT